MYMFVVDLYVVEKSRYFLINLYFFTRYLVSFSMDLFSLLTELKDNESMNVKKGRNMSMLLVVPIAMVETRTGEIK